MNDSSGKSGRLRPGTAMVLAAGLGKRMRPVTTTTPKPLVEIQGTALIDHCLDRIWQAGVSKVLVNVHYLADLVEAHLSKQGDPRIAISDERDELLETGGGVFNALPKLGNEPFLIMNSDSMWIEGVRPNLDILCEAWDDGKMDMLLMLALTVESTGYFGNGDFYMDKIGLLQRRSERTVSPFAYSGVCIAHPRAFSNESAGRFSLNRVFDSLIEKKRLFGVRMDGIWLHVGTPESINHANEAVHDSVL